MLRVGRCFLFQHGGHVSNGFTAKQRTKVCFWHFRWEISNAATESWAMFDQHCPVWQSDPSFVIRCPGQTAFGYSWSLVMQIHTLAVPYPWCTTDLLLSPDLPCMQHWTSSRPIQASCWTHYEFLYQVIFFWSDEKEWFWAERRKINRSISLKALKHPWTNTPLPP